MSTQTPSMALPGSEPIDWKEFTRNIMLDRIREKNAEMKAKLRLRTTRPIDVSDDDETDEEEKSEESDDDETDDAEESEAEKEPVVDTSETALADDEEESEEEESEEEEPDEVPRVNRLLYLLAPGVPVLEVKIPTPVPSTPVLEVKIPTPAPFPILGKAVSIPRADPITTWFNTHTVIDLNAKTPGYTLLLAYNTWATDNIYPKIHDPSLFGKKVTAYYKQQTPNRLEEIKYRSSSIWWRVRVV